MEIVMKTIGTIHSPFKFGNAMPVQSVEGRDIEGYIEMLPE